MMIKRLAAGATLYTFQRWSMGTSLNFEDFDFTINFQATPLFRLILVLSCV